ncbi:SusC/RagA family TonB-linked outer membrane protein [Bacteroidia bacterium]|nr:SusC/RagA family TonB-linked outer membrane protein [Bacteroidia bacterium]
MRKIIFLLSALLCIALAAPAQERSASGVPGTAPARPDTTGIAINDVVVVGYGTMSRKDLTSSISSISAQDLVDVPVSNIAQALAGRVAGLQITESSGAPDAQIQVRVRGGMSITQDNSPLYIIDGFPAESLQGIDASDIQRIDVLKDAAATAIYGARGANGIVIVTTKSGKSGAVRVSYDMYYGIKKITNKLDVLDARDFARLDYERNLTKGAAAMNSFIDLYGPYADIDTYYRSAGHTGVDWQDEVFGRTPTTQQHKFSVTGGNSTSNYSLSYTRSNNQGLLYGSGLFRDSFRGRFNFKASPRLTLDANVSYTDETTQGMGSLEEGGRFSKLRNIVIYRPTGGVKQDDAAFLGAEVDPVYENDSGNVMQNPVVNMYAEDIAKRNRILSSSFNARYRILDNLTYAGQVSMRTRDYSKDTFYNSQSMTAKRSGGAYGSIDQNLYSMFMYNNTLTYSRKFNKIHDLSIMAGQELIMDKLRTTQLSSGSFPVNNFGTDDISLGALPGKPASNREEANQLSFFGRANYSFDDRYIVSATLRADGSSRFAKGHRWGYFPSISGAWRISEEEFMKSIKPLSTLKLRAAYGTTGNNNIANYLSRSIFESDWVAVNNAQTAVYLPSNLANTALTWESNHTTNIALEAGLFRDRLSATVEFYNMKTENLLLDALMPYTTGYSSAMRNVGSTRNRGVEISIQSVNIHKNDFRWQTQFNISFNRNEVLALAGTDQFDRSSGWSGDFKDTDYLVRVGQPLGQMYGYRTNGVYTVDDFDYNAGVWTLKSDRVKFSAATENTALRPGSRKYVDISGNDEVITTDDREVIGNANPKFYGGLNNTLSYKGIDLSVYLNFSYGGDIYNANAMLFSAMNTTNANTLKRFYDNRYTVMDADGNSLLDNPAALAAANAGRNLSSVAGSNDNRFSDQFVEDGSFLRINNITLGYTFPKKLIQKIMIQNLRVYATVNNLHTFTKYSGYDPEVSTQLKYKGLTPGVDWGAYPRARSFVFGLNVTF